MWSDAHFARAFGLFHITKHSTYSFQQHGVRWDTALRDFLTILQGILSVLTNSAWRDMCTYELIRCSTRGLSVMCVHTWYGNVGSMGWVCGAVMSIGL